MGCVAKSTGVLLKRWTQETTVAHSIESHRKNMVSVENRLNRKHHLSSPRFGCNSKGGVEAIAGRGPYITIPEESDGCLDLEENQDEASSLSTPEFMSGHLRL